MSTELSTSIQLMDGTEFKCRPCPHCGSTELTQSLWCKDDGEVDAVECIQCLAGAPITSWNLRVTPRGVALLD